MIFVIFKKTIIDMKFLIGMLPNTLRMRHKIYSLYYGQFIIETLHQIPF